MFRSTLLLSIIFASGTFTALTNASSSHADPAGLMFQSPYRDMDVGVLVHNKNRALVLESTMPRRILNETTDDEDHHHEDKKKWGEVIGLTLIVNLATLSGVIFFIPLLSRKARAWVKSACWSDAVPAPELPKDATQDDDIAQNSHTLDIVIPSFASGALLATSVFLILPEALVLINAHVGHHHEEEEGDHAGHNHIRFLQMDEDTEAHDEHEGEMSPDAIWRFGASLLAGFIVPLLFEAIAASFRHKDGDQCTTAINEKNPTTINDKPFDDDIEAKSNSTLIPVARNIKWGLVTTIIVGDVFHNFCDGIFIGIALSLCSRTTAYTVMAMTVYHEVAQELADYFLLTKHAGLKPLQAFSLNFVSGLSVVLGGIAVLASPISDLVVGVLLSYASGNYMYIAACECIPRVQAVVGSSADRIISIMTFIIGAVPIGLTLLNHSHCEAGHEDH
jgi:zinc transporter ZupT